MKAQPKQFCSSDAVDFVKRLSSLQRIFGSNIEVTVLVGHNHIVIKGAGLPDEVEIHKPESPEFSNKRSFFPVSQSGEKAARDTRPDYYG